VGDLVAGEPDAEFAILVPEAPTEDFSWEGEFVDVASQRADSVAEHLKSTVGARVVRTAVGASNPLQAMADELRHHPDYGTLIICTLPRGVSRWLRMDIVHHAERRFGLPVIHVVARASR
jgi:hypothetical protein